MGVTYYVSASEGEDTNHGRSEEAPWRSMKRVNKQIFQPGDQILLKTDDTWNGFIKPQGSGTKANPIRLSKYGEGGRPKIHGEGTTYSVYSSTILLENLSNWRIENLEITNIGQKEKVGEKYLAPYIRGGITLLSNQQKAKIENIKVRNCYVHDVVSHTGATVAGMSAKISGGMIVLADYRDLFGNNLIEGTDNTAGFHAIEISQNIIYRVMHEGIRTKVEGGAWPNYPRNGDHVTIKNNYIEKTLGDGIVMSEIATTGLVEGNIVRDCAYWLLNDIYYAAVWSHCSDQVLFQYNEVFGTLYGQKDGEAFDADNQCQQTVFQYNYSHNNRGGALLVMDSQKDTVFRYNVSVNDGWGEGEEIINDHATATTQLDASVPKIYNNTFYINQNAQRPLYGSLTGRGFAYFVNNIVISKQPQQQLSLGKTTLSPDSLIENNLFPSTHFFKEGLSAKAIESNAFAFSYIIEEKMTEHGEYSLENQGMTQIEQDLKKSILRLQTRMAVFKLKDSSSVFRKGQVIPGQSLTHDGLNQPIQTPPSLGAFERAGK